MKRQNHIDKAEEEFAAEARKLLDQADGQDTAAVWAAVAAWAAVGAGREWPENPAPRIVPPGLPKPRLPGVGPLPGP
jgi:hypothetical protein